MKPLPPKYIHLLHGGNYNPEQWLDEPGILERDIELMKEAHINCGTRFLWMYRGKSSG